MFFFNTLFIYFIYLFMTVLGLLVFVWGLSLVAASGGHSSSRCGGRSSLRCAGLSLSRPLPLRGTGSRCAGSVVVAHGPSCSAICGIFPDQGSNLCPLHWQADSQPLHHQGSPHLLLKSQLCQRNLCGKHGIKELLSYHYRNKRLGRQLHIGQLCKNYIRAILLKLHYNTLGHQFYMVWFNRRHWYI